MARQRRRPSDDDLIALAGEYAVRRIYEPGDDAPEPDEVPPGPSGTAMSDAPGTATAGGAVPDHGAEQAG
jgi:hypothetical protein